MLKRRPRSSLPENLRAQLRAVEPSADQGVEYRPCRVVLDDQTVRDHVYLCESSRWFRHWGVDPEDDSGKDSVSIERVVGIEESPDRLPPRFANLLYQAGESSMGGCTFQLQLRDGRVLTCSTGNAVDFLAWPAGVDPSEVAAVVPHWGAGAVPDVRDAEFAWCLYEDETTIDIPRGDAELAAREHELDELLGLIGLDPNTTWLSDAVTLAILVPSPDQAAVRQRLAGHYGRDVSKSHLKMPVWRLLDELQARDAGPAS